mgnify:FL=1|jgi:lipopolysaccharide assembly outer membrane protein LptD (OstA)
MLLVLTALSGFAVLAWSQQVEGGANKPGAGKQSKAKQPTEAPKSQPAEKRDDDRESAKLLNADSLFRDKAAGVYYCKGNVVFSHKGVLLYCDEAEYYDETDSAKATGNLRVVDPEATITGDLLTADFEEEIVVVTGNVRVVAQKKSDEEQGTDNGAQQTNATGQQTTAEQSPASDDSKSARKSDEPERLEGYAERVTTITCDELEYHYNEDIRKAYAAGKVKAVQEDKTVWADNAVYDQIADEITLTGNVRLKTDDGDELLTQEATVSIAEDWIRTGQVSGVTFRRKSESKED